MKNLLILIIALFILAMSIVSTLEFQNDLKAVRGLERWIK